MSAWIRYSVLVGSVLAVWIVIIGSIAGGVR